MSKTGECPATGCGQDFVSKWLALIPFAWDGVIWFRDAIATIWDAVTAWGG